MANLGIAIREGAPFARAATGEGASTEQPLYLTAPER